MHAFLVMHTLEVKYILRINNNRKHTYAHQWMIFIFSL